MSKLYLSLLFFIGIFFLSFNQAGAEENSPWHLQADKITANDQTKIIEAKGNIYLYQKDNFLKADYIRYYIDTNWIYLKGNVKIKWSGDLLEGKEAEFDLKNKIGWIKQGKIFIPKPHLYIKAHYLERKNSNTYVFKEATLTSCDGTTPAWSLKTSSGTITIEGYAKLWNTRFLVKDYPVLYSPFLIMPAKTKRQSGLLLPQISYSSQKGYNYNQPYFQVINDEQDITLYENYYSKKNLMHGLEYRFTPNLNTKGLLRGDYLYDPKIAKTEQQELSQFQNDGLIRPNHDRFWLRGKINSFLFSPEWETKIDIDYVSDQNYLREFKSGYSGFNYSRKIFLKQFGRDIEETDDLTRTNILSIFRSFKNTSLNAKIVYTENLKYRNHNLPESKDPTIQRLPELNLNLYKTTIPYFSFDIEAQNQAVYFWRRYGTIGKRIDIYPKISKSFKFDYFTLIPKFGYRETLYFIDKYENENSLTDTKHKILQRNIYDFSISSYTELFKIYDFLNTPVKEKKSNFTKLKHTIKPELKYKFRPDKDQRELPYFDSVDRLDPQEELTYSLTNLFTLRKDTLTNNTLQKQYLDFLRIKFEQSYDFREARRNNDLNRYKRRPFSDILTEVDIKFLPYLSHNSKTYYSCYLHKITEHEHLLELTWPDKIHAYFGLDFQEPVDEYKRHRNKRVKILKWGGDILFIPRWKLSLIFRHDLEKNKDLEKTLILSYFHQCFSLDFTFSKTDYEDRYQVMINLLNFGSMGK
ncbi:LPS-assembly protein [Desulfonauticus submarinus]|uniref:LPS-assembly protein n=1 Tax=Desulfonauticus submarinus TaxID=206665 RepID=A0A1H0AH72_9BACT|nr:LPS assembly protein LptD [Desulfonauticus submarinus]SDN32775.1 LPS-assembly protein [Desulfonauticus submarinus]